MTNNYLNCPDWLEPDDLVDDRSVTITVASVNMPNLLTLGEEHSSLMTLHSGMHMLGLTDLPAHDEVVDCLVKAEANINRAMIAVWC